jgi:uncharacterized repeat protein (TIGR03803 family)
MSFAKFAQLVLLLMGLAAAFAARPAQAQTETVLHSFIFDDGSTPTAGLTSDGAGNFFVTTVGGGAHGAGTVFELSPNGSAWWNQAVLHNFTGGVDGGYQLAR